MDKKNFTERKQVEVHIGMGLPGSGKTTYLSSLAPEHGVRDKNGVYKTLINLDRLMREGSHKHSITKHGKLDFHKLFDYATCVWGEHTCLICIDSLCLTRATLQDYLTGLYKISTDTSFPYGKFDGDYRIIVDQWEENREQCLVNDQLRNRSQNAKVTIENATYEPFDDVFELREMVKNMGISFASVDLVDHKVAVPEEWQLYTERPGRPDDARYMRSEYWSLGGTICGYDNYERTISADDPKENDVLDKFLEEHAPDISLLQYKKIVKECVTLETEEFSDYYGGHTREQYWRTDMKRLYEMLKEMNLLK